MERTVKVGREARAFRDERRSMLKISLDATLEEDVREFGILYISVGNGGARQKRNVDVQEREAMVFEKLRAISAPDPAVDNVAWDALQPRVLVGGDLLLEVAERDLCLAYVIDSGWPAHLSGARRALQRRLENAERVEKRP